MRPNLVAKVEAEVDKLVNVDVIQEVQTIWLANIILVRK